MVNIIVSSSANDIETPKQVPFTEWGYRGPTQCVVHYYGMVLCGALLSVNFTVAMSVPHSPQLLKEASQTVEKVLKDWVDP